MTFNAIEYLNTERWRHISMGLSRMKRILELLNNPQDNFKSVHVAGTNGKGSTCAYLSSILRCAGYRVGTFTSPYISRFEERIVVSGDMISEEALLEFTLRVKDVAEIVEREMGEHPTEFELMFAVACLHFARCKCDICVIECGLGGRLDATNVITPILSIITPISLDHTSILGNSLVQIAKEKAGIVKAGIPCLSAPQEADVLRVLQQVCDERDSLLFLLDAANISDIAIDKKSLVQKFSYEGLHFETSLLGSYQPENACLAIEASRILRDKLLFSIEYDYIFAGVKKTLWPGRFEVLSRDPLFVVDGAHNPSGARVLVETLSQLGYYQSDVAFVVGVLADKDYEEIVKIATPLCSRMYTFDVDNPRTLSSEALAQVAINCGADAYACNCAHDAIELALKEKPEGPICAFGSLYSIAAIKTVFDQISSQE